ncbi:MAG TPA: hypothetical protein VJN70_13935 [Gemmatimonadaceae bacterium]|nr:hypothetical protein [Gemmatimonadaceae bacterium]
MSRPIVLVGLVMLAACEQPLAPAPRLEQSVAPVMSRAADPVTTIRRDTTLSVDGTTVVDQCTNESIVLSGSIHVMSTIEETANGATLHSRLHTKHVTGVGLVTGTNYRFIESMRETETVVFVPSSGSGEVAIHTRIISLDGLENSFADIVFTFTLPSFTPTYKVNSLRCVDSDHSER